MCLIFAESPPHPPHPPGNLGQCVVSVLIQTLGRELSVFEEKETVSQDEGLWSHHSSLLPTPNIIAFLNQASRMNKDATHLPVWPSGGGEAEQRAITERKHCIRWSC